MKHMILPLAALLPVLIVLILAAAGISLDQWVYITVGIVCPLVAGAIWLIYRDAGEKG